MARVVIVAGAHNSGKTTFIEKVIGILSSKGYKVAYIKHDPKGKAITDREGKDSWRVFRAGAQQVLVVSPDKLSLFISQRDCTLESVVGLLNVSKPDIILVEGFKNSGGFDKYEVIRKEENRELMLIADTLLKGVITDYYPFKLTFDLNDPTEFAEFLEKNYIMGEK
ncbi:MAG: molybdopterin-guanine dinucleotide biosynthesis protein B [Hydrogenothermaceae bacterium]|nr:molybdopterin-guanine dinucleotide biosynthesis protein B [Hydrogenothermaceae bacterium]